MDGYQGQLVAIFPAQNMVVVRLGLADLDFNELLKTLYMRLSSSILLVLSFAFIQCKVKAPDKLNDGCVIGTFVLQNTNCIVTDSTDKQLSGTLFANNLEMKFQYGSEVSRGLQDTKEYIQQSFRAYHYRKFFDYIHMDPKVHKIYRDSADISQIKYIQPGENRECTACNVELSIKFRNKIIPFAILLRLT